MSNDETLGETWRATDQLSDITDVKQRKYKNVFDSMKQTIATASCHVVPIENQNMKGMFLLTSHQRRCLLSDRPGWALGSFPLLLRAESLRGERKPAEIFQSLPHIFCLCVSVGLWVFKFYGGEV